MRTCKTKCIYSMNMSDSLRDCLAQCVCAISTHTHLRPDSHRHASHPWAYCSSWEWTCVHGIATQWPYNAMSPPCPTFAWRSSPAAPALRHSQRWWAAGELKIETDWLMVPYAEATYHFGGIVLLTVAEDIVQPRGRTVGQHTYHFHSDTMLQQRGRERIFKNNISSWSARVLNLMTYRCSIDNIT